jgi:hypothetical protein
LEHKVAEHHQVLSFLRPNGGYISNGTTFESIDFIECESFTKTEYEAAFAQVDAWKAQAEAEAQAKRQALLDKLGITEDEARLLLGGN